MRSDSNAKMKIKQPANRGSRPTEASPGGEARVIGEELSPEKNRVNALSAQVRNIPETREEKVAALRSAVEQGNYNVSNEQTAGALMSEMAAGAETRRSVARKKPPRRPRNAKPSIRRDPHEGENTSRDFFPSAGGMDLAADAGRGDCS